MALKVFFTHWIDSEHKYIYVPSVPDFNNQWLQELALPSPDCITLLGLIIPQPLLLASPWQEMSSSEVEANGWTAVSVSAKAIIDSLGQLNEVPSYAVQDLEFPSGDTLVGEAQAFAKARLSPEAYNHSMRVFYWGELSTSRPKRSKKND